MVSVIIPNYNHEKYLQQRIESVLNQSYDDYEIIILDDCSTDNSKAIIEQFRSNPKITKIIYNELNSNNTFLQWEKGIQESNGELIWIAESDDYCECNFLKTLVDVMDSDLSISVAYAQSYVIDELDNIQYISVERALAKKVSGSKFIQTHMTYGNSIVNSSMAVFRKQTDRTQSKKFLNFKFCGDWMFWIEQARNGNVFISGRVLNYYRQHPENLTNRYSKSGLRYMEDLKVLFYLLDEKLVSLDLFKMSLVKRFILFNLNEDLNNFQFKKEIKNMFLYDNRTRRFRYSLNLSLLQEKIFLKLGFLAKMILGRNSYLIFNVLLYYYDSIL